MTEAITSTTAVEGEVPQIPAGLSVAIIMDGNGRWATAHGLPVTEGHRVGGRALRRTVEAALDLAVSELTVYAFSTENWQRPPDEVSGIMQLLADLIGTEVPELHEQGVRVRFMGSREGLDPALLTLMDGASTYTAANTRMTLVIAFNYGGRAEIVESARHIVEARGVEALTEDAISTALYLPDLTEPDVVIRTAGEQRISNFLTWQTVYSEFVFVDGMWPDFDAAMLKEALIEYARRTRRFGGR